MNYKIEVIPDASTVKVTMYEQYSFEVDDPVADQEIIDILEKSDESMFLIVDLIQRPLSLDDVIHSSNKDARGENALFHHPKVKGLLVVTESDMVRLAAKGLNTVTFGNVNARAFKTADEALDYARSQVAS